MNYRYQCEHCGEWCDAAFQHECRPERLAAFLGRDFDPTPVRALNEEQRQVVERVFGRATLPPDSLVAFDGSHLIVEQVNLDQYIELNPQIDMRLCADGELRFPVKIPAVRR